jgi:hypothetical protein
MPNLRLKMKDGSILLKLTKATVGGYPLSEYFGKILFPKKERSEADPLDRYLDLSHSVSIWHRYKRRQM